MRRQQAWRLDETDRVDWLDVLAVFTGGLFIVLTVWVFLAFLTMVAE